MEVHESILELIGNTPLVRLGRIGRGLRPQILAKVESLNPGGSVKDRIGLRMIEYAETAGLLKPGGTIVEPTSGNTGVGLAIAAAMKGYRTIFVMPDKQSAEKVALLKAYGAEVVITPTAVPPESPESYYRVADRLAKETPGGFQPNQYFNAANPETHYLTTGPEIWRQTDGKVTHFVCGVGTGGTVSGTGKYLKEQNADVQVVGADPEGSILSGGEVKPYKIEGIGEDFWPGTFDRDIVDKWVRVTDRDSFRAARRVTREEGILIGGSGGSAIVATIEVAKELDESSIIVVLLPDTGRNYLSKLYSDQWMQDNGFLERMPAARVAELLRMRHGDIPEMVAVSPTSRVGEAINMLQEFGISQMPVARLNGSENGSQGGRGLAQHVDDIVGSIQERSLLAQVFRDPAMVENQVGDMMDAPLDQVDLNESVESVVEPLLRADSALVAVQGDRPVGVITRSDLLEYIARSRTKVT